MAVLLGLFLISVPEVFSQVCNSRNAVIPKAITTRNEKKVFVSNVNFRFDSYVLDKNYLGNRMVLDRLNGFVDSLGQKSVKTIEIVSQSSPEGRFEYNSRLSRNRAESVKAYLDGSYSSLARRITLSPDGESWGQLREYVVRDSRLSEAGRNRVLAAIDSRDGMEARKRKMSLLGSDDAVGDIYAYLLDTYYPLIRNSAIYLVHDEAVGGPKASITSRKADAPETAEDAPRSAGRPSTADPVSKPAPAPSPSSVSVAPTPSNSSSSPAPGRTSSSGSPVPTPSVKDAVQTARDIPATAPQYAAVMPAGSPLTASPSADSSKKAREKKSSRSDSRKRKKVKESGQPVSASASIPSANSPLPSIPSAGGPNTVTIPL